MFYSLRAMFFALLCPGYRCRRSNCEYDDIQPMIELRLCFIVCINILDYCGKQYANRKTYIIQPRVELHPGFTAHMPCFCIVAP